MYAKITLALMCFLALVACNPQQSTDAEQAQKTEQMVASANQAVGLPDISSFTEKRFAKLIYELRDQEISTYSYFMDFNGKLHFLCESIGYGLPYSVQYVSPDKQAYRGTGGFGTLPQAEPNGLFMPDSLSATWVLCSDGKGGIKPVYSEPSLIVSPIKLTASSNLK